MLARQASVMSPDGKFQPFRESGIWIQLQKLANDTVLEIEVPVVLHETVCERNTLGPSLIRCGKTE